MFISNFPVEVTTVLKIFAFPVIVDLSEVLSLVMNVEFNSNLHSRITGAIGIFVLIFILFDISYLGVSFSVL